MRLLLDESVPRPLRTSFPAAYEVRTVPQMGWAGTVNGILRGLAADSGLDALLTVDRGFAHQQNLDHLPLPVVIMLASRDRPDELRPLVPETIEVLSGTLRLHTSVVKDLAPQPGRTIEAGVACASSKRNPAEETTPSREAEQRPDCAVAPVPARPNQRGVSPTVFDGHIRAGVNQHLDGRFVAVGRRPMQGRLGIDRDVVEAVGLDALLGLAIRINAGPEQESYALRRIRPLPALGHGNMQQVLA